MILDLFDVQCDSCGDRLGSPKVADWQALGAASDAGWHLAGVHLCPKCKDLPPSQRGGSA
jgi:hypothetical protein